MAIDRTFPHSYECEWLLETQQTALPHYYYPGASLKGGRDGVLIRITPEGRQAWLGTFANGQLTRKGTTGVFTTPNPDRVCVVAAGEGYLVSANRPTVWDEVSITPVIDVRPIRAHSIIVIANFTELVAYGRAGIKWRTRRLTWDSLQITEVTDASIKGEFWDILSEAMETFIVDLETGADSGGIEDR
jgi:hypothetical protein